MGRTIDGQLILGWEVEVWDAVNYDEEAGLTEDAERRVDEILGKTWAQRHFCEPITFKSLYYQCDYMYVGLMLMNEHLGEFGPKEYGEFLSANAELLTETAKELYTAIMGTEPVDDPMLLVVGREG